ncbi:MAG: toxin-antitoxin system YwqK family antitoxin [Cytophagaceae bacterium]
MKSLTQLTLLIILLFGQSCSQKERSEIEIVKCDENLVKEITSTYDSTYIENPHIKDFWTIEHYLIDSIKENIILKDSLNNIVVIVKRENGKNYFSGEFYSNGQLKGDIKYSSPGTIDGPAKYYYDDGRVRSIGIWKEFKMVGEWKNYDNNGWLESIEYYDRNGELIKKVKI